MTRSVWTRGGRRGVGLVGFGPILLALLLLLPAPPLAHAEKGGLRRDAYAALLPFGVRGSGADDPTERREAIREGLTWLAAHQSPNGGWEAKGFGTWCNGSPQENGPDGAGDPLYDAGVTGLALLAFLHAGYAGEAGSPHAETVERGLTWLKKGQDAEGCVGSRRANHYIYNHAYGAAALTEAFGMTGDPRWHEAAQRALDFSARARNPTGGWRYGIRPGDNDTSATAAVMTAVHAARTINDAARTANLLPPFELDPSISKGVIDWIDRMTDPEYGRTGYIARGGQAARPQEMLSRFPGELSEATTAMGLFVRLACGQNPYTSKIMRRGVRLLSAMPPRWEPDKGHMDLYYWEYGSTVMRQIGGEAWDNWLLALDQALIPNQRRDTTVCLYSGSWDPLGPWGPDGGRVYATAVAVLALDAARAHVSAFPLPAQTEGTFRERTLVDALRDDELDVHIRGRAMRTAAERGMAEALPALRDALHAKVPELRAHAARAIGELDAEAVLALPSLIAVLGDPYEVVRVAALEALGSLGDKAASAAPHVAKLLEDPQPAARRAAAHAALALRATEAIPGLETQLKDKEPAVRVAAACALAGLKGPSDAGTGVLIEALGSGKEAAALEAIEGLQALGAGLPAAAREKLRAALESSSLPVRLRAAEALVVLEGPDGLRTPSGRASKGTRATVDKAFETKDGPTVRRALALLGTLGPGARPWLLRISSRATLDASAGVRSAAVNTLGSLGETARTCAAALHLAGQDPSPSVREAAKEALAKVKPTPGSEIDGLIEALQKSPLAQRAMWALAERGGDAVPALIKALESKDDTLADGAARVLTRIGDPAVSALIRALGGKSSSLRRRAATVLGRVDVPQRRLAAAGEGLTRLLLQASARSVPEIRGTLLRIGRPAVPSLLAAFATGDPSVKTRVLDTVARILPPAGDVLPTFLEGLGHTDEDVRRSAAEGLARYGPQASGAVAALAVAVRDEDATVRKAAVTAIGNAGRAADEALPLVVAALKDDEESVATAAQAALTCLDRVTLPVASFTSLEAILSELGSANVQTRRAASASLVLLGEGAKPALDRLVGAMADTDPQVRSYAAMALARQGKAGAAELGDVLKKGSSVARQAAIEGLRGMGRDAVSAAPIVIEALMMGRIRNGAVETLGRMGKPAVSQLARALADKRAPVRHGAAEALALIGPDASSAKSALIKLAKGEREKAIRQAALDALATQGRNGRNAIKNLVKPPAKIGVRRAAAETLGAMGVEAKSALSSLKSAERREKDARVKEALGAAIVRIENGEPSTQAAPPASMPCDRNWRYLDESLPTGVDTRVEALLRFDGSTASLEDRAQRAFDLIPYRGSVQYIVEPTSGLVGLDLEKDAALITGEVPRNLITRGAFTLEILLRSNDPDGALAVVGVSGETAATNVPWMLRTVKGKLQAMHEVEEGRDVVAPFDAAPADELRLLTLTRGGFGQVYCLYVNGRPAGTVRVDEAPQFGDADKYLFLGPLKAVVLGVRVTGTAFSPTQAKEAYERIRRE